MSFKFPPLSIPPHKRIGLFCTTSPKKSGKSTVLRVAANEFSDAGYELVLLRHDIHNLLEAFAPTVRIELAKSADIMRGKTTMDLKHHAPLTDAMLSLPEHPRRIVMLDASAPGSGRIGSILQAGRFNKWLADREIFAIFCVPLRPIEDSAQGALEMMDELHAVMPDHFVVPVPICDPNDLDILPDDHLFFQVIKMARHGVIHLPALSEEIASGLERLDRPLSEIADPDSEEALAYIAEKSGHNRLMSGLISEGAQDLVLAFEEAMRPLALTPGGRDPA